LGVTYRVILSAKNEDGEEEPNPIPGRQGDDLAGDLSALWFRFGGGVDFSFTDKIYLRGEVLYGLRLANKFENDLVDFYDKSAMKVDVKPLLGHGLEAKVAVGVWF
jgi:hypothetical protein